ncbi:calcium-activated potassium channel subunit beta-4-like isoform X2 [Stegostoma tigrinum]|uniref:calcium-activated potassium channel subunit beta-4-like isoform X2 n=1 Tax=Stegostoma tigrinum TaxID=3053191 RepID=UPI00202B6854|nr:calcium-activated potassium channel subunit beta-4-like isoform X2 [Stegostoma tigrinum]
MLSDCPERNWRNWKKFHAPHRHDVIYTQAGKKNVRGKESRFLLGQVQLTDRGHEMDCSVSPPLLRDVLLPWFNILQDHLGNGDGRQCSYIPPCERDNQKNSENVMRWHDYWKEEIGSQTFMCYINQQRRPDDALLKRAHDENVLLHCVLWPLLTLLVGVLIVLLTICGKSLAVRAEALQKMKYS